MRKIIKGQNGLDMYWASSTPNLKGYEAYIKNLQDINNPKLSTNNPQWDKFFKGIQTQYNIDGTTSETNLLKNISGSSGSISSLLGGSSGGASGGLNSALSGGSAVGSIGNFLGGINKIIPSYEKSNTTNTINTVTDTAGTILSSIPTPVTQALGLGIQAGAIAKKGVDWLSGGKAAIENAKGLDNVLDSNILFTVAPGLSLVNSLSAKKIDDTDESLADNIIGYKASDAIKGGEIGGVTSEVKRIGNIGKNLIKEFKDTGGIKGEVSELTSAFKSGSFKNYLKHKLEGITGAIKNVKSGFDERELAKNKVDYDNLMKNRISLNAMKENSLAQTNYRDKLSQNESLLTGGYNPKLLFAKNGTNLESLKKIIKNRISLSEPKKYNVIPSGALHARRHSIKEDNITKKGIPVVTYEKGDVIQHAEIEKNELILTLDVTKKLEQLKKDYKNGDESALVKAGKLLTLEILENTKDNTGLINTI